VEAESKNNTKKSKISLLEVISGIKNFFLASQSIIGLDIGTSYIKLVQLQKIRNNYTLTNYRVRALPLMVKDNPQQRRKIITAFLNEFISEARIKTTIGRLALWGAGSYVFSLTIPSITEKELKGVVGVELKKKLPFQVDLSRIFFNYFVTSKFEEEKGITFQITCIAMDKYVLEENIRILKDIGIRPMVINIIPDALGNLIKEIAKEANCVAVLDMGVKESVFSVYKKGLLQFSRQIPIGGEQFTQVIMKTMVTLGMKNVTEESAEKVKRQCGIPLEEEVFLEYFTDFGVIKGNQIAVALRPLLERFNTEINRTINYYYRTFRENKIDCLYLTGGSSRLKNIDRLLNFNLQNINIGTIEKLNPLSVVKGWMDSGVSRYELVMEEAAPHLSAVLGLCINRGGKVNLLPPKEILEQRIGFLAATTRIVFILLLAIILGTYTFSYGKCLLYKKLINATQLEINGLSSKIKQIKDYMALKGILTERKSLLENAIGRQPLWMGVLKELSNITPQGMALRHLKVERKGKGRKLYLAGEVLAEYTTIDLAISQYLVALDDSPFFTNVKLVSTERDVYSPIPKADFEIECDLVY